MTSDSTSEAAASHSTFKAKKHKKSYRCPKFDGNAKQTLEIRVERKRNLKLGELGDVNFGK